MNMLILAAAAAATNLTTTLPTVVVEASRTGKAPLEMAQHVEVAAVLHESRRVLRPDRLDHGDHQLGGLGIVRKREFV